MNTDRLRRTVIDYAVITAGAAVYALSVHFFTAPNRIAPGGVTGIATMLHYLIYVPIGASALVLNIPLFIWGAVENGVRFLLRTVIATALCSFFVDLFALIPYTYEGDRLLAAGFGGLFGGMGLALIFLCGGTTGGTDIIARNVNRHFPFLSIGTVILLCDVAVVALAAIVWRSLESALYSVIAIFVSSRVIDAAVFGFSRASGKLLVIITASPDQMVQHLTHDADRGVTVLSARGGYSGESRGVILCAAHTHDVYRVRRHIAAADPDAFVITAAASAISGVGFSE